MVIDDLLDVSQGEGLVQVDEELLLLLIVVKDTIVGGRNNGDRLVVIHCEELWLLRQGLSEGGYDVHFLGFDVHDDDRVLLGEDDLLRVSAFQRLKVELHGDLVEDRVAFNHKVLDEAELVHLIGVWVLDPPEQEQLIGLLLLHDQVLTTDDTKHLLVGGDLHRNDLIWLPLIVSFIEEWDLDLALLNLLE